MISNIKAMICLDTVYRYCSGNISEIENYEMALNSLEKYDCHHRLETDGEKLISVKELKEKNLYFNRPPKELIFLTHKEHVALHGRLEEHPGHEPWNKGFRYFNNGIVEIQSKECPEGFVSGRLPRSKEWSEKISKSRLDNPTPLTDELRKKLRDSHLGYKFSDEHKKKLSLSSKGRKWYNNGVINKFARECPEGFVPGKLSYKINKF